MKCFVLALSLIALSLPLCADQITFSIVANDNNFDVQASMAGFKAGPAFNELVSDAEKGLSFPLSGIFTTATGAASTFLIGATTVVGSFGAGTPNSVDIINPTTLAPIVKGEILDGSKAAATFPGGTGSFSGEFLVTFVDPTILAKFGLPPTFDPRGSVGVTFGQDQLHGADLNAVIGGGVVTVVVNTPPPVPEPASLFLFVLGSIISGIYYITHKKEESV